jgi:hypothetical protein
MRKYITAILLLIMTLNATAGLQDSELRFRFSFESAVAVSSSILGYFSVSVAPLAIIDSFFPIKKFGASPLLPSDNDKKQDARNTSADSFLPLPGPKAGTPGKGTITFAQASAPGLSAAIAPSAVPGGSLPARNASVFLILLLSYLAVLLRSNLPWNAHKELAFVATRPKCKAGFSFSGGRP